MPGPFEQFVNNTQGPLGAPPTGSAPNPVNPDKALLSQMLQASQRYNPTVTADTNPNTSRIGGEGGVYNTSDESKINIDKEVTNSRLRNMWNSFKRGIDEIQISTAQGKFEYNPTGESYGQIIDNYPDQKKDLDSQLERGVIDPIEYQKQVSELDTSYQSAITAKSELAKTVASNEQEIKNEPVSKDYQYKNWLVQSSGSNAALGDKLIYSMPQIMGSSASLMVPQLAATFGTNITKALIKTAVSELAGPEVGIPVQAIATIGAIAASVAEVVWGRSQESYGEVGGNIIQDRQRLMEDYARKNNIRIEDIPEEVQRQIRIQSRKGADVQFKENMALAANDVAQALLMPGSKLAEASEGLFGGIGQSIKAAGDYSKMTRLLRAGGKLYGNALSEKFEEGFQQAASYRATDQVLGTDKYTNKGLMASILTDSYDTAASLNYSLIPGITLRGNGKYSDDKEFQFSEDSGGMLGLVMGGIPAAISIGKDITTYRRATRELAKQGIIDPENKVFGLQNSILETYFKKDQVPFLIEAMRSLKDKKDDNGNDIFDTARFNAQVTNIREAYQNYSNISDKIDNLKGDKWAFFTSKELRQATDMIKHDLFHYSSSMVSTKKDIADLQIKRDQVLNDDTSADPYDVSTSSYRNLNSLLESAVGLDESFADYIQNNPNLTELDIKSIERRKEILQERIKDINNLIETERNSLTELGVDLTNIRESSPHLDNANTSLLAKELFGREYESKYNDLLKIKTNKQAKEYYDKIIKERPIAPESELNNDTEEETPVDDAEEAEETEGYVNPNPIVNETDTDGNQVVDDTDETETPATTLANFTGTTVPTDPEAGSTPSYVNPQMQQTFRDVLDDLDTSETEEVNPENGLSIGDRVNRLEQGLAAQGINLNKISLGDLYQIFKDNFANDPEYVKNKFELLRAILQAYKSQAGATPEELKEIRNAELNYDTLELSGIKKITLPPPTQTPEDVEAANSEVIKSIMDQEIKTGTGLKITSGLSLATKNIVSARTSDGSIGDSISNNQIQFIGDTDQQLINTSFVTNGTELSLRAVFPENFDFNNTSDDNYDLVDIQVYKATSKFTDTGRIYRELLVGSLHRLVKLPELLAETADVAAEVNKLRAQRKAIIQSKSKQAKATVTKKGFGFLNLNLRTLQSPVNVAFAGDSRVHISTVDAVGQPIQRRSGYKYRTGLKPLIPGAVIAWIPNAINDGISYIPMYLTKQKLATNNVILNKTLSSITEFLKTGSRRQMQEAEKYVYITQEPAGQAALGLKGVFWAYDAGTKQARININGRKITTQNIAELKAALSNVYFTVNKQALTDKAYEEEVMNSGLLTTNITPNKILNERVSNGEYNFFDQNDQYSYFSQHTIELGNFSEGSASVENVTQQTAPQESPVADAKQEISNLRKERLEAAKALGFAFENGKGSLRNLYDTALSFISDESVITNPDEQTDLIAARGFIDMYDQYETKIKAIQDANGIKAQQFEAKPVETVNETPKTKQQLKEEYLKSITSSDLLNSTKSGETRYTINGIKVVFEKEVRDKYGRGANHYMINNRPGSFDYNRGKHGDYEIINKAIYKEDPTVKLKQFEVKSVEAKKDTSLEELRALPDNYALATEPLLDLIDTINDKNKDSVISKVLELVNNKFIPADKVEQVLKTKEKLIGNKDYLSKDYLKKYVLYTLKDFKTKEETTSVKDNTSLEYIPSNITGSFYAENNGILSEVSPTSVKGEHIFGLEKISDTEYRVGSIIQNGNELIKGASVFIKPLFEEDNLPTTRTKVFIKEPAIIKKEGNQFTILKRGIVYYDVVPTKYLDKKVETTPIVAPVITEENTEVKDELDEMGIDVNFDLFTRPNIEFDNTYKANLSTQIGVKNTLGARYTDTEIESIRGALKGFNKDNGTTHVLSVAKVGKNNAIALILDEDVSIDNIGETSLASRLIVSPEISVTMQNQMVDSIAYMLLTNEKPDASVKEQADQAISNKEKVRKDLADKLEKLKVLITKPNTPKILENIGILVSNYELMTKHFDALYDKSLDVLTKLGFAQTDENSDYYENLEENQEDNNVTQFNDDSNRTRNHKDFLPAEVKKLIYFIPELILRDLTNPKEVVDMTENTKSPYYNKIYKAKPNSLGLPSFNNFNDTWEKTLSIAAQNTYTSDEAGFDKLVRSLRSESNPIIVRELADRLMKGNDQIKNAFFRRAYLQKQQNKTTVVNYRTKPGYMSQDQIYQRGTTVKTTQILNSDQKQGVRYVVNELEQDFRIFGVEQGILETSIDESTGRTVLRVNDNKGKELYESVRTFIKEDSNYISKSAVGNLSAKVSSQFTPNARLVLLDLIHQAGINMSLEGLKDLLKYYKVNNAQQSGDERAVAIQVFQNTLFARLAGVNPYKKTTGQDVASEEEVRTEGDYEVNNPFKKDITTIFDIARYEFPYKVQFQSGSYRSNGKSYYPFVRHNYLSEAFTDMTAYARDRVRGEAGEKNIFAKLQYDVFGQKSLLLSQLANPLENADAVKILKLRYELGTRNRSGLDSGDKLLQEMTEREHQITKITDFQNSGNKGASFHYDTLSDKTTKPIVDMLKLNVIYDTDNQSVDKGNIQLSPDVMNVMFRYFEGEYDRINLVNTQSITLNTPEDKHKLIKAYHTIGGKLGLGSMFNIYYFLNKAVLDVDNVTLSQNLYNIDGTLKPLTEDLTNLVKAEINKHFNKLYKKNKDDFKALGLYDLEAKNNKKEFDPKIQDIVDANYLKSNAVKLGLDSVSAVRQGKYFNLTQEQLTKIVDYSVVDYVTNYIMFSNEMLMITGDPAQAGKAADSSTVAAIKAKYSEPAQQNKYIAIANIASTFVNVGKRNAAFLGSGEKGKFRSANYKVAIANDEAIKSEQFEEYKKYFTGNEDAVKKAYNDGDLTDAQEVTTVEEHLHTKLAFGQINFDQYKKFLYIYDKADFNRIFPGETLSVDEKDRFESYGIVMQPDKPVQRTYNVDKELGISKQYYIKTSSFPLVPSMVKGTPLESLLKDMQDPKNDIKRVAFVSAVKQGVAGAKNIFNNEGDYTEGFLENNSNELNRDGFRIQLEVPYKDYKDAIREGTQLAKLLFVDIPEDLVMSFLGRNTTVADLKTKYVDYHRAIVDIKTNELLDELGAEKDTYGRPIIKNLKKLAKIIQEEGIDRGYSINSLLGLDLNEDGEFKIPLTFLPNTGQIQPVLTAIVSNRISRLKMPGKSYVQGSEFILQTGKKGRVETDLTSIDQRNIVWTKPEYSGLSKLKYLREEEGKVKPAQIVMPFYFVDKVNHKKVDLRQYTTKDAEGRTIIDASKIDPELLEMNGFRIPFQGHNSGMWFEIVGFLPYEMGDLIVVPGEIAAQMGSDYDVDKLYAYMFNYTLGDKISKVSSENPTTVEAYQNALIDIHKAIFTSRDMFQPILDPLSFADVEEAIEVLGSEESKSFQGAFDPIYQRDVYFSNRGGQLGVGITANANTSHAIGQSVNLFIKGEGIVFQDEQGNNYVDNPKEGDTNGINKIDKDTYGYQDPVSKEHVDQNQGNQTSAWRLDKVYTFTNNPKTGKPYKISNLISQLLGVSVDNAKEQKLGAYGLNKHNFNVAITIIRSGFDLIMTKAFINQPILKEYYQAIGSTEDIFNTDFTPNKKEKVIKDIVKKYTDRYQITAPNYETTILSNTKGLSLNELRNSLQEGQVTAANANQQLNILGAFLHYKTLSDGLQALTSALNVDTKGLPKNVSDTIVKEQDMLDNITDNAFFGNTERLYNTIPGLFTNLPGLFNNLFSNPESPIFAYGAPAYQRAQQSIKSLTGREFTTSDKLDTFHNHIKQFLYSSNNHGYTDTDADYTRNRLLFDYEGNESLQTRHASLLLEYPENDLLKAISPVVSIYPNDPKLLEIPSSNEEDFADKIRQYWQFMANGEEGKLKTFANALVSYALLVSPQEYGTSNMVKYIPFEMLEQGGLTDVLNEDNKNMYEDEEMLENFTHQFIQHNLDYVLSAKEDNFLKGSVRYKEVTVTKEVKGKTVTNTTTTNIVDKFTLPAYIPEELSKNPAASLLRETEDGNWDYPTYLAFFVSGEIGKQLYKRQSNADGTVSYYRIDKLGTNNVSEYSRDYLGTNKKSLFEVNQSSAIIPSVEASVKTFESKPKVNLDMSLEEKYFGTNPNNVNIPFVLDRVKGSLLNMTSNQAAIYSELANALGRYNMENIPVTIQDNSTTRAAVMSDDSGIVGVAFNPKRIFTGDRTGIGTELDGIRTILHELTHVVTVTQIDNPSLAETKEIKQFNKVWEEYKDIVRNESKAKVRGINTSVFDAEVFSEIVERLKYFKLNPGEKSDIYTGDFNRVLQNILKSDQESTALLAAVGKRFTTLAQQGKIEKGNFDLTSNAERLAQFKNRLNTAFVTNMNDSVNKYYAYYSNKEFAAEALTNPVLQDILRKIPSVWERVKSAIASIIARILGLDKNERSLLDDAIDSIMDIANLNNKYTEMSTKPNPFLEVLQEENKVEKTGTQFNMSRQYRLPSGKTITFNDQQYEGLQKINEFIKGNQNIFTLSGFAGTGKTTIVKAILDTYRGRVGVTAPTHKAKNVISKTTGRSADTIQKLLGLRPNTDLENFDPNKPVFDPLSQPKIGEYDWVILDEASMLNKALFNLLVKEAKQSGVKLLFMGDSAQIPPVGESLSLVFNSPLIEGTHQLDKVERQAGSNPLMSVYDKIRSNISSLTDQFDHKTKLNDKGEGIEFTGVTGKFRSEVVKAFTSAAYNADRNFAKFIAFTNDTVGNWNSIIRESIFGQNAAQYEVGDTLMSYSNIDTPRIKIENSSDYIVRRVMPVTQHGQFGLDGFLVTIQDVDEKTPAKEVFIVKNDEANKAKYFGIYTQLQTAAVASKRWAAFYAFRHNNLLGASIMEGKRTLVSKDFDYGYAITAHKSQGSTYTNVFVHEGDIDTVREASDRNRLKYVAFSRPTNKVLSFSNKTESEGTNFYIQQDDMLASLPRDVNEVTDKELNELLKFCK